MRQRRTILACAAVATLGIACVWCSSSTGNPLATVPTAELIDQLVNISSQNYAIRTNILWVGEETGKPPLPDGLLMRRAPDPKPSQAMEELIRRGASAVPELVAHLGDKRPTQLPVPKFGANSGLPIMMFTCGYEYDYNRKTTQPPPGVATPESDQVFFAQSQPVDPMSPQKYAVGDICFDILGKIVNRRFQSVRFQPTLNIVFNGPSVLEPVRNAATREWGGLTPEVHRQRLMADISNPDDPERAEGARELLARYYPNARN
jgi:hypothetical protein